MAMHVVCRSMTAFSKDAERGRPSRNRMSTQAAAARLSSRFLWAASKISTRFAARSSSRTKLLAVVTKLIL
jgi:hypothetical protein